jgi:hypothetical protein
MAGTDPRIKPGDGHDVVGLTPAAILPVLQTGEPKAKEGDRVQDAAPVIPGPRSGARDP